MFERRQGATMCQSSALPSPDMDADANYPVPIDSIIKELGFGKFQAITLIFVVIAMSLKCIACTTFIFSTREPLYRCRIEECETAYETYTPEWLSNAVPYTDGAPSRCARYSSLLNATGHEDNLLCKERTFDLNSQDKCVQWIHEENYTLVEELRLECQDWKRALVGTVNGLGQLVCFVYAGLITDKYGRKNMMVYASAISGVLGTIQSFSTDYWMFAVLEFLNTAITSGVYNSAFVLGIEILPPSKRVICTCFLYVTNSLALMLLGAVAWQFRHWRTLLRITYCPTVMMIVFITVIPKSLKWLIAKGSHREAAVIIRNAARLNGVILSEKTSKYVDELSEAQENKLSNEKEELASVPFRDVLRSPRLRLRLLVCTFCWITNSFVYYGLMVNSVTLTTEGTNMYLNFVLVCAVEIPGQLVYLSLLDKFGRRYSLSGSLLLCGLACAMHAAVGTSSLFSLLSFLAAKLLITVSYSIIYVYTAEMFPTTVRNSCLSYCCMVGSLGTLAAPQTALLKPQYAVLLYGLLSLLSGVSVFTFPETTKIQLPDTIAEAEKLGLPRSNKVSPIVN